MKVAEATVNSNAATQTRTTGPTFNEVFAAQKPADATVPPPSKSAPPTLTLLSFGDDPKPKYRPDASGGDDGAGVANELLREESEGGLTPNAEAQYIALIIQGHRGDSTFLQDFMNGLGSERVAEAFEYLSSGAYIASLSNPAFNPMGLSVWDVKNQFQYMADALSTLVNDKQFDQDDMDKFVAQFAKSGDLSCDFFAKDVLGKASAEVNQMFYQSAKAYALDNNNPADRCQSMAADAMQALSQTSPSYSMQQLAALSNKKPEDLKTLVQAAMKGEAAHGNIPTIDQLAMTHSLSGDGQGDQMTGLSSLIFNAAYSGYSDRFCPPQLSAKQAADLQANLFADATDMMVNDPSVASFYTKNVPDPTQSVSMKDALAADFQEGYDSIVDHYRVRDDDGKLTALSGDGETAFREFFADVVFSPPTSNRASGAVNTILNKLTDFHKNSGDPDYATCLGNQLEAMNDGLSLAVGRIRDDQANADQNTKELLNIIVGVAGAAAPGGAPVVKAFLGGALNLAINQIDGSDKAVQDAINELKEKGIYVGDGDTLDHALRDNVNQISNKTIRDDINNGMDHTHSSLDEYDKQKGPR